jgi:hypothetical protein
MDRRQQLATCWHWHSQMCRCTQTQPAAHCPCGTTASHHTVCCGIVSAQDLCALRSACRSTAASARLRRSWRGGGRPSTRCPASAGRGTNPAPAGRPSRTQCTVWLTTGPASDVFPCCCLLVAAPLSDSCTAGNFIDNTDRVTSLDSCITERGRQLPVASLGMHCALQQQCCQQSCIRTRCMRSQLQKGTAVL